MLARFRAGRPKLGDGSRDFDEQYLAQKETMRRQIQKTRENGNPESKLTKNATHFAISPFLFHRDSLRASP
jgi:hypothetical protein